jgi:hypothetical protein
MHRFSIWSSLARFVARPSASIPSTIALLVMSASPAAAQTSNLEVGTVLTSGKVIWVRATTSGAVEFFMSQGYRDALARPSIVDANRLAQWTDNARALHAPATGVADAKSAADSGLAFDRWVGTDSSGLEIREDGSTVLRVSDTPARELVDLLARGAQLTQHLSAPARPVAVAASATVGKDTAIHPSAQAAPAPVSAPTPTPAPEPEPAPAARAATITMQQVAVASPSPASTETAAPVSVAAPAMPVPPSESPAPAEAATPAPAPVDSAPPAIVREPNLEPSIDANIPRDPAPRVPNLAARRGAVAVADVTASPLPPAELLDKHIQTPLGPFVVPGAKLIDRDTQIKYCYTELGLRYDRHLTGDVTVRVNVSDAGLADTVEVTKRTWDGVAAAEVESCMRALIEDWSFEDRQPADSKTIELHFTLTPAMRTATTDGAVQQASQPR